jgi:RHS repeat-associated protein
MTTKARTEYFFREMLADNVEECQYGVMDSPAYCVGIRDTNGNVMQFAYETVSDSDPDPWIRTILTSVTDTAGRSITFEYEQPTIGNQTQAGQRISSITDPNGNVTTMAYNSDGFLQTVTEGASVWSFTYYPTTPRHRHIETKSDPNANVSRYVFVDDCLFVEEYLNGRLTLRTDRDTVPTGSPTTITNANGDERIEAFEPWDNTWSNITDEEGFTITNTFDNWRNLLTEDDRNGVLRTYTYDAQGNKLTATVTDNSVACQYETMEYTDDLLIAHHGPVINDEDENGLTALTTTYVYNSNRNLIRTIEPVGQAGQRITEFVYNSAGQVVEEWRGTVGNLVLKREYVYESGTGHLLQQIDDPDGEAIVTTFEYDVLGEKVLAFDGNGNVTKFVYDRFGRVTRVVGPCATEQQIAQRETNGEYVQNTYDGNGNLITTRDELNRETAYEYNDLNLQTLVTDALNNRTIFEYDFMGNRTKVIDARTLDTSYSALMYYDKLGRLVKTVQNLNIDVAQPPSAVSVTKFILDGNGNRVEIWGPAATEQATEDIKTYNTYDALNRLTDSTDPEDNTSWQTYDPRGNVLTVEDARFNTTTHTYDLTNKLTKKVQPLAVTMLFTYDIEGNLLVSTGPWYDANSNGLPDDADPASETINTYDNLNRLLTTQVGGHDPSTYDYDANSNVVLVTDPEGHETSSAYDPRNQVVLTTNNVGEKTRHVYDLVGNRVTTLTAADTALETRADFEYDALNRLWKTHVYPTRGNLNVAYTTVFAYDAVGNKISELDAKNNLTQFFYDAANRLIMTIDALNCDVEFGYDARGNRLWIKDQNDNQTSFIFDLDNRVTEITEPTGQGGASVTYLDYDEVGNLISRTDANGDTVDREYDALNRLIVVTYPNSDTVEFGYDGRSNRLSLSDGYAGVDYGYQYDDRSLLTQFQNVTWNKTVTYEHDEDGKRTEMVTPDSGTIDYSYDGADRIDKIRLDSVEVVDYDYDGAGRRTRLLYGNDCYALYGYDDLNRLSQVGNYDVNDATISSFGYEHDAVNNRTSITFANNDVVSFGYDAKYQLTSEERVGLTEYSEAFTYSPTGNRTQRIRITPSGTYTTGYSYNNANQLTSETTNNIATAYSHDANGNITQKVVAGVTWTYGYDYHNRQISVTNTIGNGLTAGYVLDYDSKRLSKTVNSVAELYLCDGDDVIADYAANGSLKSGYVNSLTIDSKLMRVEGSGSENPGALHFYHYDALGSVVNVTAANAAVENTYYTNGFGEDLTQLESLTEQSENIVNGWSPNVVTDRYQFTGRERDAESRLMHYRKRTLDPRTGRFLQKDPSGMPEGPNRYIYVRNNPVNAVDPWGLLGKIYKKDEKTGKNVLVRDFLADYNKAKLTQTGPALAQTLIKLQAEESIIRNDARIENLTRIAQQPAGLNAKARADLDDLIAAKSELQAIVDANAAPGQEEWSQARLDAFSKYIFNKLGDQQNDLIGIREKQLDDIRDQLQRDHPEVAGKDLTGTELKRQRAGLATHHTFKYKAVLPGNAWGITPKEEAHIEGSKKGKGGKERDWGRVPQISEGAFQTEGLVEYVIAHEGLHVARGDNPSTREAEEAQDREVLELIRGFMTPDPKTGEIVWKFADNVQKIISPPKDDSKK